MPSDDIREQLKDNHEAVMAQIEALRNEGDERRCRERLEALRQSWVAHVLAEEAVVYRTIEGPQATADPPGPADKRLVESELLQCFFERLSHTRPGSPHWFARLEVVARLLRRRIEAERGELFARLARDFEAADLSGMGRVFGLAREKLTMLEAAKVP